MKSFINTAYNAKNVNVLQHQTFGARQFKPLFVLLSLFALCMGAATSSFAGITVTASPGSVCVGDKITVVITEDCANNYFENGGYSGPTLTDLDYVSEDHGVYTYKGTYFPTDSDGGLQLIWTVWDDCYPNTDSNPVNVVMASSVTRSPDYDDNWTGNQITFTVNTVPTGVSCPDTITWTGDVKKDASGNFPTGLSTAQTYNTTGGKQVTATLGASLVASTASSESITIHQLVSKITTPNSDCLQKDRTDLGIGETVDFSVDQQATVFKWDLVNGGDSSIKDGSFKASRTAGETPAVTCQLGDASGPVTTYSAYKITAPTGVYYTGENELKDNLPPLFPPKNRMIVNVKLRYLIQPATVSFANAVMYENVSDAPATFPNPPPNGTVITISMFPNTFAWPAQQCGYRAMDTLSTVPIPYTYMSGGANTVTATFAVTYNYVDSSGITRVPFGGSCHHDFCYKTDGSTYVNAVAASTTSTSDLDPPQGPYQ